MIAISTLAASLCAIVATVSLFSATVTDPRSAEFFGLWCGAPYLGYGALAFAFRRDRNVSGLVLVATVLSGGVALLLYSADVGPIIEARRHGLEPPMNCGGPLVELGMPLLQWCAVLVLEVVAFAVRSRAPVTKTEGCEFL